MSKIPMNQTQINYFADRVRTITRIKERDIQDAFKAKLPHITKEEKLGYIMRGEAELHEDITPDKCNAVYLINAFVYPGDDVREAVKSRLTALKNEAEKRLKRAKQKLIDRFVLRDFPDGDTVDLALKNFGEEDFMPAELKEVGQ